MESDAFLTQHLAEIEADERAIEEAKSRWVQRCDRRIGQAIEAYANKEGKGLYKPRDGSRSLLPLLGYGVAADEKMTDAWLTNEEHRLSIEFPNGHSGYVLETRGMAVVDYSDEVVFPYLTNCYIVIADLESGEPGNQSKLMYHAGPQEDPLIAYCAVLQRYGAGKITLLANDSNDFGRAQTLATRLEENIPGVTVKGIDLKNEQLGKTIDVHICRGKASACRLSSAENQEGVYEQMKEFGYVEI